jgi:molecular chaperone HscB
MFSIPRSFVVSGNDLKKSYHKLMEENHPDRLSQKVQGNVGDTISPPAAVITQAYTTLLHPYERAVHMLGLYGKSIVEESSMNSGMPLGMEFLVQIMEIREVIESTTDDDRLVEMLQENRNRMDAVCVQLTKAFDAHELDNAVRLTQELQYWNRIEETLRQKIEVH